MAIDFHYLHKHGLANVVARLRAAVPQYGIKGEFRRYIRHFSLPHQGK